jgi:hypothetical protein
MTAAATASSRRSHLSEGFCGSLASNNGCPYTRLSTRRASNSCERCGPALQGTPGSRPVKLALTCSPVVVDDHRPRKLRGSGRRCPFSFVVSGSQHRELLTDIFVETERIGDPAGGGRGRLWSSTPSTTQTRLPCARHGRAVSADKRTNENLT